MKAIFNDIVIAESERTVKVGGKHYFPPNEVNHQYLEESRTHTTQEGMGEASFYHVKVNGEVELDAAWSYTNPEKKAEEVRSYIAFTDVVELKD
ncbi:DUF427 domain-containing protein [Pontibacter sp. FD36]|uniref:DUF427 domain-containing protein n=1 Tax=Pontibacter sp. FD36 TaxID=2789860 RepID=UPI0018A9FE4B|nr:DUF427 domain-containing protein [Pontibacter sp. FD36]MBF8961900.1 DUF427 domain-containing protein [Pontibacter sp. FD36]